MHLLQSAFTASRRPLFICAAAAGLALVGSTATAQQPAGSEDVVTATQSEDMQAALGTYVGNFGPYKITVSLDKIVGRSVTGYSIVTGNERAFSGSWHNAKDGLVLDLKEPGDHAEDGSFYFLYDSQSRRLTGRWDPQDSKLTMVELTLERRTYKYDKSVGQYAQASSRKLVAADVENLRPEELRSMRNEIYARHGYSFQHKELQEYFAKQAWYMPVLSDVRNKLTTLETKNLELIKRYENYGSANYDRFGR